MPAIHRRWRSAGGGAGRTSLISLALPALAGALLALVNSAGPVRSSELKPWTEGAKPSFALDDLHGRRRDLQAFKGKVVLVHFFATWCEPCVDEIASLQRLQSRGKPLAVIAVNVAEVELRVRAFFEKLPVDFPVLLDRDRAVTKAWGVAGLPSTFVLDADLAPRLFVEGDLDWSHADILKKLEALYPTAAREAEPRSGG